MGVMMRAPGNFDGGEYGAMPQEQKRPPLWLRLTSYHADWDILGGSTGTFDERALVRRSRWASWIILGMFILLLLLLLAAFTDLPTMIADLVGMVGTIIATVANRFGKVSFAAILLILLVLGGVLGALFGAPNGALDTIYLPAYDLLVIPLAISAALLRPVWLATFGMMVVNILAMIGDMLYQPIVGDLAVQIKDGGIPAMLARPIGLQIVVALVLFLIINGFEAENRRADRAEELAELERRELERQSEMEEGVRQLLAVHVHLANGDFNVRAPAIRNSLLWQIGSSLNNLVARLGRLAQADFVLRRTQEEANRITEALYMYNSGRSPIWPAPSNTPLDRIVDVLRASLPPRGGAGGPPSPQIPPSAGGYSGMGASVAPPSAPGPASMMGRDRPSSAYPGSVPPGNNAVPEWMRSLMPDGSGQPQPPQPPQQSRSDDPRAPMPNPASPYGAPISPGYGPQTPQADVNPWSLEPNEPLDDSNLPAWLRQPNQE